MAVITNTHRTKGTADTLIEVGRFLLDARAASRRAAGAERTPSPEAGDAEPPQAPGPDAAAG
jgi:hypothetical protein